MTWRTLSGTTTVVDAPCSVEESGTLLDEQGVTAGPGVQLLDHRQRRFVVENAAEQLAGRGHVEARRAGGGRRRRAAPRARRCSGAAISADSSRTPNARTIRSPAAAATRNDPSAQGRLVGPLQVVDGDEHRRVRRSTARAGPPLPRTTPLVRPPTLPAICSSSATKHAQHPRPRPVRRRLACGTATERHREATVDRPRAQRVEQGRLADARLTSDDHDRRVTTGHAIEQRVEQRQLVCPAHEPLVHHPHQPSIVGSHGDAMTAVAPSQVTVHIHERTAPCPKHQDHRVRERRGPRLRGPPRGLRRGVHRRLRALHRGRRPRPRLRRTARRSLPVRALGLRPEGQRHLPHRRRRGDLPGR